ncbi:MAG: DUF721 domain-containing protein [Spirochaetaceae bacterium]|jgi:hypothetical protein|nr:DUF721 domain-containing protein [Spirochaetaceae bacterium]
MKAIGDLLALVLDKEIQANARGQVEVKSNWGMIVEKAYAGGQNKNAGNQDDDVYSGETLEKKRINAQRAAGHSRMAYIKNHVLFVETDHPGWIQILQTMRKKIIEIINREYSGLSIRSMAFLLVNDAGPVVFPDKNTGDEIKVKEEGYDGKNNEEPYRNIKDEKLKKILMRLENRINTKKVEYLP